MKKNDTPDVKKTVSLDSCRLNDSLLLGYANDFKPSSIDLDPSISSKFQQFISSIDTNCLRRQKNYKLFITIILTKQYKYHLECCSQGYDLLGMKKGGANLIINEFERLLGIQGQNIEFLNSFKVIDYVYGDDSLMKNEVLNNLLKQIKYRPHSGNVSN
jgi:hypothetical protein